MEYVNLSSALDHCEGHKPTTVEEELALLVGIEGACLHVLPVGQALPVVFMHARARTLGGEVMTVEQNGHIVGLFFPQQLVGLYVHPQKTSCRGECAETSAAPHQGCRPGGYL